VTVYVDPLQNRIPNQAWRYSRSCHMYTDGELEELHELAERMGLKRKWFQQHPKLPHYDLTANMRKLAIRLGAVEASLEEMIEFVHQRKFRYDSTGKFEEISENGEEEKESNQDD